ncbi:hypothetical protein TDB9533_03980 [Thalassocella blandensis]|nr:hypothetical protein TDB9533_03980 [Thalassocella blandensis]
MSLETPPESNTPDLEQLLRRQDIWRGHSHAFVKQHVISSGYEALDEGLQHKGWPLSCLIEVCQAFHACEWWLFHPGINQLLQRSQGYIALLNPPALPFVAGLQQLQIETQRLLIIQSKTAAEFVTSFSELSQCDACTVVLAWQPKQALNYTALRKLQLSTQDQHGLYVVFRHAQAKSQSSPASLRLLVSPKTQNIHLNIFKQKGKLQEVTLELPVPPAWHSLPLHRFLDGSQSQHSQAKPQKKHGNIVALNSLSGGRSHESR